MKKSYWYKEGDAIISSHDIPSNGIKYIEKTINIIGVPDLRAVSIKDSDGQVLYSNIEHIPLDDNFIEHYLKELNKNENN